MKSITLFALLFVLLVAAHAESIKDEAHDSEALETGLENDIDAAATDMLSTEGADQGEEKGAANWGWRRHRSAPRRWQPQQQQQQRRWQPQQQQQQRRWQPQQRQQNGNGPQNWGRRSQRQQYGQDNQGGRPQRRGDGSRNWSNDRNQNGARPLKQQNNWNAPARRNRIDKISITKSGSVKKVSTRRLKRAFKVPKLTLRIKTSNKLVIPAWMFTSGKFLSISHLKAKARLASLLVQKKKVIKQKEAVLLKAKRSLAKANRVLASVLNRVSSCSSEKKCIKLRKTLKTLKSKHVVLKAGIKEQIQDIKVQFSNFMADLTQRIVAAKMNLQKVIGDAEAKIAAKKEAKAKLMEKMKRLQYGKPGSKSAETRARLLRQKKLAAKAKAKAAALRAQTVSLQKQVAALKAKNGQLNAQLANIKVNGLPEVTGAKAVLTLSEANQIIAKILRRVKNPPKALPSDDN